MDRRLGPGHPLPVDPDLPLHSAHSGAQSRRPTGRTQKTGKCGAELDFLKKKRHAGRPDPTYTMKKLEGRFMNRIFQQASEAVRCGLSLYRELAVSASSLVLRSN